MMDRESSEPGGSLAPVGAASLPLHGVARDGLDAFLASLPSGTARFLRESGFAAQAGRLVLLPAETGGIGAAILGLGERAGDPWTYGHLARDLPEGSTWHLGNMPDPRAATLGWLLGAYRYTRYRKAERAPARLVAGGQEEAVAAAEAICRVRDLINTPAADLGPEELAGAVADLAARHGATSETVSGDELASGFPAVAAVGKGASRKPRVAILQWTGDAEGPLVALCGKGVCFDTGGLDLKGADGMKRMKKDMGGAAVLIGLADLLMRAKAPIRLLLLVGAVENAVSADAMRPLDVLQTRKGLTVEVGNTDAEGRLVLADLLARAGEEKPDLLIDAATLTGAARVALGPDLPALYASDDALADTLLRAGRAAHDPAWRMPLHDGYDSWLDSNVADLNNVAARPMAGSIVAALFLRRFVPHDVRWAHLDLYCWNDSTRAGRPEGGEASFLRGLYAGVIDTLPQLRKRE